MRVVWIPETSRGGSPAYALRKGKRTREPGDPVLTRSANLALKFRTEAACRGWIQRNPGHSFRAVEHAFYD